MGFHTRTWALVLSAILCSQSLVLSNNRLPGAGLDVPVDVDGDGISSFGDRYVFNLWLESGGSLAAALTAHSSISDSSAKVLNLSVFFSDESVLSRVSTFGRAAQNAPVAGQGAAMMAMQSCGTTGIIVEGGSAVSIFEDCQTALSYTRVISFDDADGIWIGRSVALATENLSLIHI